MSVEVLNETEYQIYGEEFQELAAYVLEAMHVSPAAEMSLIFVEPDAIAALHERWLDLEGPTDVMSFPMDELRPGSADSHRGRYLRGHCDLSSGCKGAGS